MKLINSSAQYLPQQEGIDDIYKQIELAGRTSYLSYDKITDDSAKKFVDMLIKSKHLSVLEHGTVYLSIPIEDSETLSHYHGVSGKYNRRQFSNPYSKVTMMRGLHDYVTTNLRVLQENDWLDDLKYLCEPTKYHEKRLSVRVICSRSIAQELTRHRAMSFTMESQRYVGYDKGKFDGEITYIIPSYISELKEGKYIRCDGDWYSDPIRQDPTDIIMKDAETHNKWNSFLRCISFAEQEYLYQIRNLKLKPQQAREILPNATKTTIVITAFESDWRNFFDQRLFGKTGDSHPDMVVLAEQIKEQFEINGLWDGIMKYPSKYEQQ